MPLPSGEVPRYEAERVSLRTHLPEYRPLFRFFAKKTEPKNASTVFRYAETGECFALLWLKRRLYFRCAEVVGTLPGFRCPTIRAAVCDFLPLRHLHEMWICGGQLSSSRTHAIGHRGCNPTFGWHPFCLSPTIVGATIGRPKTDASHYPHGYVRNVCLLPIGSSREGAPA